MFFVIFLTVIALASSPLRSAIWTVRRLRREVEEVRGELLDLLVLRQTGQGVADPGSVATAFTKLERSYKATQMVLYRTTSAYAGLTLLSFVCQVMYPMA